MHSLGPWGCNRTLRGRISQESLEAGNLRDTYIQIDLIKDHEPRKCESVHNQKEQAGSPPGLLETLGAVQSLSRADSATPWTAALQASLSFTISWSLRKLMSVESVMPSSQLSSSVIPFSCSQPFPVSGSSPMSWLFASDGQSPGVSASTSVLPMNIQG